ncbi:MAG: hypothetical protein Q4P72_06750 [Eubacteriales bacterium]|nr:hypothetical protein [Eubacteriales bacterium]
MAISRLRAMAKINLNLHVLEQRKDGYHQIFSLMQAIALSDYILFQLSSEARGGEERLLAEESDFQAYLEMAGLADAVIDAKSYCYDRFTWSPAAIKGLSIDFAVYSPGIKLEAGGSNILSRLLEAYFHAMPESMRSLLLGQRMELLLLKMIPSEAGLGGASADAAALLWELNRRFPYMGRSELLKFASEIGADIPFCMQGGTAICEGIGEKLRVQMASSRIPCLILKPHFSVSTAQAYAKIDLERSKHGPQVAQQSFMSSKLAAMSFVESWQEYYQLWRKHYGRASLDDSLLAPYRLAHEADYRAELDLLSKRLYAYGSNDFYNLISREDRAWRNLNEALAKSSAFYSAMTGSGSAFFALFNTRAERDLAYEYFLREREKFHLLALFQTWTS